MKSFSKYLLILIPLLSACSSRDITQYVDPNIGGVAPLLTTKAPTVHRPHSMVRIFPITKSGLEDRYLSDKIYGFTVNMPAYRRGYVTELMPTSGKINADRNGNASNYDHDMEDVHPWYHKVMLEDSDIIADWTATERSVIYRFQYNKNDDENVIFRSKRNSSFKIAGSNAIQG